MRQASVCRYGEDEAASTHIVAAQSIVNSSNLLRTRLKAAMKKRGSRGVRAKLRAGKKSSTPPSSSSSHEWRAKVPVCFDVTSMSFASSGPSSHGSNRSRFTYDPRDGNSFRGHGFQIAGRAYSSHAREEHGPMEGLSHLQSHSARSARSTHSPSRPSAFRPPGLIAKARPLS